jgi:hypothetical protein
MVQQKDAHKKQIFAYIIFNLNNSTSLINSLTKDLSIEDTICIFQDKNLTTQNLDVWRSREFTFF